MKGGIAIELDQPSAQAPRQQKRSQQIRRDFWINLPRRTDFHKSAARAFRYQHGRLVGMAVAPAVEQRCGRDRNMAGRENEMALDANYVTGLTRG